MRDFVINLVREGAKQMCDLHGRVSPWRLSRNIHIGTEVIKECLSSELGYVEKDKGNFVLKKGQGKAKAKELKRLEDADISSFKVSNDIEFPNEVDYTTFSLNKLRLIASNKRIKVALSHTRGELIKKLKSRSKLSG